MNAFYFATLLSALVPLDPTKQYNIVETLRPISLSRGRGPG